MYSIGIDSVEINRIEKAISNPHFFERVFGESEIEELKKRNMPAQSIAAAFAAKEAFSKAIGKGFTAFYLCDVQVLHEESGKPYLKLSGNALKIAQDNNQEFDLSITHTKDLATAVVISYKVEK